MSNDPVIHDQSLNQAFRQDIPKKPEPTSDSVKISWVEVVPKYQNLLAVQLTVENIEDIARLHGFDMKPATRGLSAYIYVPTVHGEVQARVPDWLMVADENWDIITVCTAAAFNRNYEVKS
jgi:hypothetical protein